MSLTIVVVHPDLLGTYGDGGNGLVLAQRARWRGIAAELIEAPSGTALPTGDVYCLGGGEDAAQTASADLLRSNGVLGRAVDRGAAVLAVCAGYQILGQSFAAADGRTLAGVGLLDVTTAKCDRRAVGEILAEPLDGALPTLTGFENHGGLTSRGPYTAPLARVESGVGNGDGTEGAVLGRVVGTYLHGPVLARNPALADLLLSWAVGHPLEPLRDAEEDALRQERLAARRAGRAGRAARAARAGRAARTLRRTRYARGSS